MDYVEGLMNEAGLGGGKGVKWLVADEELRGIFAITFIAQVLSGC